MDKSLESVSLESDLMDAMNAALEESENNNSIHSSSLQSVDVMDEAMMLLGGEGEIEIDDFEVDENVEEIDFDSYLETSESKETKEKLTATIVLSKASDEASDNSPTSVVDDDKSPTNKETTPKKDNKSKRDKNVEKAKASVKREKSKKSKGKKDSKKKSEAATPAVVPLGQFQNALALIQDLESRIQVLETDQQCLIEENEQLRETTNKQAAVIADMEAKLARFPKLLEQTVEEESKLAAKTAENQTKHAFWSKEIQKQEREHAEEKLKKNRDGKATTASLKQADLLKEVVERQEEEAMSPRSQQRMGPLRLLGAARRAVFNRNSNNNNNSSAEKSDKATLEVPSLDTDKTSDSNNASADRLIVGPTFNIIGDDDDGQSKEIEDDAKDPNVLDLVT